MTYEIKEYDESKVFTAKIDDQIIGYATVIEYDNEIIIDRIDIEESFQGHGFGTEFIRYLVSEYGKKAIVAPDNDKVISLYERLGEKLEDWEIGEYVYYDQGFGVYVIEA